jgi:CRP-like cAMP-binding protein
MKINIENLRAIPLLAETSDETLSLLLSLLKEERFMKGQYIVHEGDPADAMYIIISGEVEMRKVISRKPEKFKTLSILENGDIFGEMALFGYEIRSADVFVRNDSILWKLDYSELLDIVTRAPIDGVKILQAIIQVLAFRIKSMNNELAALYELNRLLPKLDNLEDLTKVAFELTKNSVQPAENGLLAILNTFNEEFDIYQFSNTVNEKHIQFDDPIAIHMFDKKSPIIIKKSTSDHQFKDSSYAGLSFIASPFLHEDALLGFMIFSNSSKEMAFNYNHMILLSAVCNQVASKINDINRRQDDMLKKRLEDGKMMV